MAVSRCEVHGCMRQHKGLGYCAAHYRRFKRHGSPMAGKGSVSPTPSVVARRDVDPDTLARLRELVGVAPEGPTREQLERWRDQEREGAA